ncbi:MAG: relaxase/mobilization nuclease domain-containing protein [Helicobacteraceae bacterium]|jgi:hypothetical protein|nr:relaxase/mobilization nuclease domain-containing protein [Helicobacteraceae bacterium]
MFENFLSDFRHFNLKQRHDEEIERPLEIERKRKIRLNTIVGDSVRINEQRSTSGDYRGAFVGGSNAITNRADSIPIGKLQGDNATFKSKPTMKIDSGTAEIKSKKGSGISSGKAVAKSKANELVVYQFGTVKVGGGEGKWQNAYTIGKDSRNHAAAAIEYLVKNERAEIKNELGESIDAKDAKKSLEGLHGERRIILSPDPKLQFSREEIGEMARDTMNIYREATGRDFRFLYAVHTDTNTPHAHVLMLTNEASGNGVKMYKDELFELKAIFNGRIKAMADEKEIDYIDKTAKLDSEKIAKYVYGIDGANKNALPGPDGSRFLYEVKEGGTTLLPGPAGSRLTAKEEVLEIIGKESCTTRDNQALLTAQKIASDMGIKAPDDNNALRLWYGANAEKIDEWIDANKRKPSSSLVERTQKITDRIGLEPEGDDRVSLIRFVDCHQYDPSQKMIEYANKLSEYKGRELSDNAASDMRLLSKWIKETKELPFLPREKALEYAESLSKRTGYELTADNRKNADTLDEWIAKAKNLPSQKQLNYAESLSKRFGVELSDELKINKSALGEWIDGIKENKPEISSFERPQNSSSAKNEIDLSVVLKTIDDGETIDFRTMLDALDKAIEKGEIQTIDRLFNALDKSGQNIESKSFELEIRMDAYAQVFGIAKPDTEMKLLENLGVKDDQDLASNVKQFSSFFESFLAATYFKEHPSFNDCLDSDAVLDRLKELKDIAYADLIIEHYKESVSEEDYKEFMKDYSEKIYYDNEQAQKIKDLEEFRTCLAWGDFEMAQIYLDDPSLNSLEQKLMRSEYEIALDEMFEKESPKIEKEIALEREAEFSLLREEEETKSKREEGDEEDRDHSQKRATLEYINQINENERSR